MIDIDGRHVAARLLLAASLLMGSTARGAEPVEGLCVSSRADLDGDAKAEEIRAIFVDCGPYKGRCLVEVNFTTVVLTGDAFSDTIHVVDIDTTDTFRELIVIDEGPSDDYVAHVLRYAPGVLRKIAEIPAYGGVPTCDGSGTIVTQDRGAILHTWYYPCSYKIASRTGDLKRVFQRFKPMNTNVVLRSDLRLVTWPDRRSAGVIRRGERAVLLETDDESWCHIGSARGVEGWFEVTGSGLVGGKTAGEVFAGLCFAD